ncbi:MAG: LpqB family beta-propeller domain-containing protein [Terracidiphilus sp.]
MSEPASGPLMYARQSEDRLESWKEIAAYLKKDVTTVQRWEKREGMPVHRHQHDKAGSVHASRAELDAWWRGRALQLPQGSGTHTPGPTAGPDLLDAPLSTHPNLRFKWKYGSLAAAAVIALVAGLRLWTQKKEYFWKSPIANARFEAVTDFGGLAQGAALSRDGHFAAFLSDQDGEVDLWVTQIGSGQFHKLTHGNIGQLLNPAIRTVAFSPDSALVTFWVRKEGGPNGPDIGVWAVPTLGGEPRPYLEGAAEFDWSADGSQLVYHTPGPGDPMFVADGSRQSAGKLIFTAPAGLHSHFPLWAPDASFIYFVHGSVPDKLDIWRIRPTGGSPERITPRSGRIGYPVLLDQRTLLYLDTDADGSGPYLFGMDVEHRLPHRLTTGPDRYTSLMASSDGRRIVATLATQAKTLWTLPIDDAHKVTSPPSVVSLTTTNGFSPRLGPNYLLYVSTTGTGESVWKVANGATTELWRGQGAQLIDGPAISADGGSIAFSVRQNRQTLLYVVQSEGTNARVVSDSLQLESAPAWEPDGKSVTVAANDHGMPHLFRVPIDGHSHVSFVDEYSVDPVWAPDGRFVVYSGPDIGTEFSVRAVTPDAKPHPLPPLTLTRGARHLVFLPGGRELMALRGAIGHQDIWLINLDTGEQRQLTHLPPEFDIQDFDISPDGHQLVIERVQEHSDVVLLDLQRR